MSKAHLRETELARLSDPEADVEIAEHVRWCACCRSVVADYRWLQGEVATALATAADAVVMPRPKWWAVQEVISTSRRRQAMGGRLSAVAGVVLAVCLMLSVSPVLGTAIVARTLPPEPLGVPAPVTAVGPNVHLFSVATPTPAISCEGIGLLSTPAFAPPPAPPESETCSPSRLSENSRLWGVPNLLGQF